MGGDGYWLHRQGGVIFLAVFDCRGGGHLASMMTRIYANALRKLVIDSSVHFPAAILHFIHREIRARFKDKENIQLNTAADLGILKIDTVAKKLDYAGAGLDLLQIDDGEAHVIYGDESPIGILDDQIHEYGSLSVDISKPRSFYVFTDGIINQKGGPELKAFGRERLINIIQENSHLPMDQQQPEIAKEIKAWQGVSTQQDDILIVGFRI